MITCAVLALGLVAGQSGITSEMLDAYEAAWRTSRKACGPVAVSYCLQRFGRAGSPAELAAQIEFGPDGVAASDLLTVAAKYGMSARALAGDPTNYEALPVPSILILDSRHCVVYEGANANGQIQIFEPADGQRKEAIRERLSKRWTGEVIVFDTPALSWFGFSAWAIVAMCGVLLSAKTGSILLNRRW